MTELVYILFDFVTKSSFIANDYLGMSQREETI